MDLEDLESPAASPWPPARILVAEDDAELRALIAAKLRASGFEVVEARDGEGLLGWLAGSMGDDGTVDGFDMVVSDVRMPSFTALDVLVGAHRLLLHTPVLLITAFGDQKLHERALRLGAAEVLDKPFSMNELGLAVCRILADRRYADDRHGPH